MAIRITGMYSGLDTESIINELASAQSAKKNKLVKAQTKLSWKQDAWKALNTKVYSFYQKLDNLRLQSSYMKKKTTVSNPNAIKVSGGTVDGTHSVSVEQLSKRTAVTSGKLSNNGVNYTGNATLKQLGFSGQGSIHLSDKNGGSLDIDVDENMTINEFVEKIDKGTTLTASYDQDNQRIYISSWTSGEVGDFFLSGNDAGGMEALKALKLLSQQDINKLTEPGGEYDKWANYKDALGNPTADYLKAIEEETLRRLKAMKEQNDQLTQENKDYDEANQKNRDMLKEIKANADGSYDDHAAYISNYSDAWTADDVKAAGKTLFDQIYGVETTQNVQARNDDGSLKFEADGITPVYVQAKNDDGTPKFGADGVTPVYETETVRTGGMVGDLKDLQKTLSEKQDILTQARADLEAGTGTQQAVADAEQAVAAASQAVSDKEKEITKAAEVSSFYEAFTYNDDKKKANEATIAANNDRFTYAKDADGNETYKEKDASKNEVAIGQGVTAGEVTAQFDAKVAAAQNVMANKDQWLADAGNMATKIEGQDAWVWVDGVRYESYNDTVTVNGLSITAMETTDKDVTVSTANDTDGVYDMIKDFVKAYSELMIEMDTLYNAESSTGYDPLLSEEKDGLTDSEIEEWEKKIKDSLLRRDSTLSDVSSAMRMSMMMTMELGDETISLASFGIETLGYFLSKDNERNAYHIDGDPDDEKTKNNDDKLRAAITNNPEAVMDFFTKLADGLHDTLQEKLSASKMSSALTVYNDKKMKEDYDDYTDKIKKEEEKLNSYIDKWYAKFSAMEVALAKLESKNNSLASLFGG